jgi:tRNA (guanine-N7-)-methyltransferase
MLIPSAKTYQEPTAAPDWQEVYGDWSKPLSLDIGCGKGGYVLAMAQQYPDRNWLGLEIREPLVHRAIALKNSLTSGAISAICITCFVM